MASTEATWSASNVDHISVEVTTDGHRVVVEHDIDANEITGYELFIPA